MMQSGWPVGDIKGIVVVGVIVAVTAVEEGNMCVVVEESVEKAGGSVSVRWIKSHQKWQYDSNQMVYNVRVTVF